MNTRARRPQALECYQTAHKLNGENGEVAAKVRHLSKVIRTAKNKVATPAGATA